MDDRRARLVILLLANPHLLEGGERGEDRSADPDGVFTLGRSNDLNLHRRRSEGSDFLLHSIGNTGEHARTSREDNVGVEILTNIDVAFHDGVVGRLVDSGGFHSEEGGLEERFRATESLVSDRDHLTVRKFVALLHAAARRGARHFGFEVERDVGEFLLDVANDFAFGGRRERVAAFGENLHHVVGEIASGQVETEDGVGKGVALVDGDGVRDAVAGIEDDTGRTTGSVERKHGLDGDVHRGRIERLEHDLKNSVIIPGHTYIRRWSCK